MTGPDASTARQLELAQRLAARLERLSAESIWAHRASGVRGALLRWLDACPPGASLPAAELKLLDQLNQRAFEVLTHAAREIGEPK
jgi:hypothetical protein